MQKLDLEISGMTCIGCARRVEKALMAVPGVTGVTVSLSGESAAVRFHDFQPAAEPLLTTVVRAVTEAGYTAKKQLAGAPEKDGLDAMNVSLSAIAGNWQVVLAVGVAAIFLADMVAKMVGAGEWLTPWSAFLLALPVQTLAGAGFYRGAYHALRSRVGSMDQLVVLGTTAAFAYSLYALFRFGADAGAHIYFESAVFIIAFVKVGKWLESQINRRTRRALAGLVSLQPTVALLVTGDGVRETALSDIKTGDRILVRAGARLPVDGKVASGDSQVDESMLTGESRAVPKSPGDPVIAGTLNGMGTLEIAVSAVGNRTRLSEMIDMIAAAESQSSGTSRLIDKISGVFVPAIVVLSGLTFVFWLVTGAGFEQALLPAIATLVIACPCALGLAIPTALVGAVGAAARHGLLIRDFTIFERYRPMSHIVFDKTGTLTYGRPKVTAVESLSDMAEEEWVAAAASLESASNHPIASAIHDFAASRGLDIAVPADVETVPGAGLSGQVNGRMVAVGAPPHSHVTDATLAEVTIDGTPAGIFHLQDELRNEAADVVAELQRRGLECRILSGDNTAVTAKIAAAAGIADYRGQQSPEAKAAVVRELQKSGAKVVMVADGVNDAVALVSADVSMAMGEGTDIAADHADIGLLRSELSRIPVALDLLAAVRAKIFQNLAWAVLFNGVGVPLAMAGLLTPMFAGLAMALSSLMVVSNAMLLSRWSAQPR